MMKLYKEKPLVFALVCIAVYVAGSSLMQQLPHPEGASFLAEAVFNLILSAVLLVFLLKHRLMEENGLCRSKVSPVPLLFWLPALLAMALPVFLGVGMNGMTPVEAVLHSARMLLVGFLEELIFRAFLFNALRRENLTRAVVISAVTFGLGHIVNLLSGQAGVDTILQVVFAVTVGFMMVFLYLRSGSILACVVLHALNNVLAGFADYSLIGGEGSRLVWLVLRLAIMAAYTLWLWKKVPVREA